MVFAQTREVTARHSLKRMEPGGWTRAILKAAPLAKHIARY